MARLAAVNLPNEKRIVISLTYIFGIGPGLAEKILKQVNIDPNIRTKDLKEEEISRLREVLEKGYKIEGELRRERLLNVKRLKEVGSYRGVRHSKSLPSRGQRTKTNSRTVRGNVRKTMGSGRRPSSQKT